MANYYFIAVDLKLTRDFFYGADSVVIVLFNFDLVEKTIFC